MKWLKSGDCVGLIAPSSKIDKGDFNPFIKALSDLGIRVIKPKGLTSSYRYMAGTDKKRADDVMEMFANEKVKAIICARGGAGSTRILDKLDYQFIKSHTKPIIGFSDSTALQNALISRSDNPALTGFLPLYDTREGILDSFMFSELKDTLLGNKQKIISGISLNSGECSGKIVGGCLSVLTLLCGTPYFPKLKNKILLLEDTNEKTYRIDLMLNQIKQQPDFKQLKGIIFGKFNNCEISDIADGTIDDCINDFIKDIAAPVIKDFSYGHIPQRQIIPLGIKVKLISSCDECLIEY